MHIEGIHGIHEIIFCHDLDRSIVHEGSEKIRKGARDELDITIESQGLSPLIDSFLIDEVDLSRDDENIVHLQIDHLSSVVGDDEAENE